MTSRSDGGGGGPGGPRRDGGVQISSIPLTVSRSKSHQQRPPQQRRVVPQEHQQQQHPAIIKYEDITRERLSVDDSILPEDGLEDLVSLPIAPELLPRRTINSINNSNVSLGGSSTSSVPPNTAPFPPSPEASAEELRTGQESSLTTRSAGKPNHDGYLSPAASSSSSSTRAAVLRNPPRRSQSLRSRTQSSPLNRHVADGNEPAPNIPKKAVNGSSASGKGTSSPRTTNPTDRGANGQRVPASTDMQKSRSASSHTSSSSTSAASAASPSGNPSIAAGKSRQRAVTNNVVSSTSRGNAPAQASSSRRPERPLQSVSPARQTSTPAKKRTAPGPSTSTPPRPSEPRHRASSTPVVHDRHEHGMEAMLGDQEDDSLQPPWLEQQPEYLYKSDIISASPGSLAQIAFHAKNKLSASPSSEGDEGGGDLSVDSGGGNGGLDPNTSARSWDDVILPTVAKQIRSQQLLEAQRRQNEPMTASTQGGFIDGDYEFLVTDYNPDGTPKKWKKISRKQKERMDAERKQLEAEQEEAKKREAQRLRAAAEAEAEAGPASAKRIRQPSNASSASHQFQPSGSSKSRQGHTLSPTTLHHRPSRQSIISRASSRRNHSLGSAEHQDNQGVNGHAQAGGVDTTPQHYLTVSDRPSKQNLHATTEVVARRKEIWQEDALSSPGVASRNGFGRQQQQQQRQGQTASTSVSYSAGPEGSSKAEKEGIKSTSAAPGKTEADDRHSGGCRCVIM